MREVRDLLQRAFEQYGLHSADLAEHVHDRGKIVCVNEPDRTMPCPCRGKSATQIRRMVEKIRSRPVTPQYAYAIFCLVSVNKRAVGWRQKHDAGADDWLWEMNRAYLRGSEYAGPQPQVLPGIAPPVAFAPGSPGRVAAEITEMLCGQYALVPKSARRLACNLIEGLLRRREAAYREGFATWLLNTAAQYRVVVDESQVDVKEIVVRTGPESSEVHRIQHPRTRYAVHYAHLAPNGTRSPDAWEVVDVLLSRDAAKEARNLAWRSRSGRDS
jgi:hypothetical protein